VVFDGAIGQFDDVWVVDEVRLAASPLAEP
jgi:hypothetical protein